MRVFLRLVSILMLCAGFAPPAHAQIPGTAPAASAQVHLERGHQMMDELEFLNAVHEYSLVLTDDDATDEQRQQARLHAGMAHRYMENDVEARMLFLAALKREPTAQLPAGNHPPKLVTFFELVREEAVPVATSPEQTTSPSTTSVPPPPAASRRASDSPNWGAITGSAALMASGLLLLSLGAAIDALLYFNPVAGSGDAQLDVIDFAGPAIGVAGAAVALSALALIPWWSLGAGPNEEAL